MHVLLIEDDDLVASGIQAGLESHDFVVDQASTLVEARMTMASVFSDVVILDLGLPDGDGMGLRIAAIPGLAFRFVPSLIAALLEKNRSFNISFVMMSSHDVLREVESGHADVGFVTLPVSSRMLRIEEWLTTHALCLVPQGHPLSELEEVTVEDLKDQYFWSSATSRMSGPIRCLA